MRSGRILQGPLRGHLRMTGYGSDFHCAPHGDGIQL